MEKKKAQIKINVDFEEFFKIAQNINQSVFENLQISAENKNVKTIMIVDCMKRNRQECLAETNVLLQESWFSKES